MKLQKQLNRVGISLALTASPALAWAAEGGSPVGDNLVVLGIAAALVAFAFLNKGGSKAAPAAPVAVLEAEAPAVEAAAAGEAAEAEEAASTVEAPVADAEPVATEAASEEAPARAEGESSEQAG